MSSENFAQGQTSGLEWWERQSERLPDFDILFGARGLVPNAYRLLAEGRPVALDRLAAVSSWPRAEVEAALRRQPGTEWDEEGRLIGFGLTLQPTPHRITFDNGRTAYTWCASDALVLAVVVGRPVTLESPCPATGKLIRVAATPERVERVDPPDAAVTLIRPDLIDDIRGEICNLGRFVASQAAAAEWMAAYPEAMVHSVEEDFQLHREVALRFGWTPAASATA